MRFDSTQEIHRECSVHGNRWEHLHNGYFSSTEVAAPFVKVIIECLPDAKPHVIADLGGGTGIISGLLAERPECRDIRLLDIDQSERQLNKAACRNNVCSLERPIDRLNRMDIIEKGSNLLFIMRSVLHYFGRDGLRNILAHLRNQMHSGEYFVHQSASFEDRDEAKCLNLLYSMMGTGKWYPDCVLMCDILQKTGWDVKKVASAPSLMLTAGDLKVRYGLTDNTIHKIRDVMSNSFSNTAHDVFKDGHDSGFTAELKYMIYICKAV